MFGKRSLRLHRLEYVRQSEIETPEQFREEAILRFQFRSMLLAREDDRLLPQGSAFQCEPVLGRAIPARVGV